MVIVAPVLIYLLPKYKELSTFTLKYDLFCVVSGDITHEENVKTALQGADCVFHIASFGNSGKEMLQTRRIHEVNIEGTRIILDVCLEFKIKRLVYVSTYNVVFGGKEIVNGDENLPYIPPHQHISPYARSKAFAERLVLSYNAKPFR